MNNNRKLRWTRMALAMGAVGALFICSAHAEGKKPKAAVANATYSGPARYAISFPSDTWGDAIFDVYTSSVSASDLLGHFRLEGRRPLSINGVNVYSEKALDDLKVHVSSDVFSEARRFVEESSRYAKEMGPCEAAELEYFQMEALPDDNPRKAWLKKKLGPCPEQAKKYFQGYKSLGSNEDLKKLGIVLRMRTQETDPSND